jgi:acyl-CoA synthetase (NDP forming)
MRKLGVPCFPSPERALRALALVTSLGQHGFARTDDTPLSYLPAIKQGILPEHRAKELLKDFGIPVPDGGLASSLDQAVQVANRIGFPVVLKAQAVDLPHKSDAGGVILDIENENALTESWFRLHRNLKESRPGLVLEGVLVERMGPKAAELIAGARNDPEWGPVLLVGFGGVLAEAMRDVRLLPPNLSVHEIGQELNFLQCSVLFRGFRGSPPLDVEAVAQILFKLGRLIRSSPEIEEIDINPIVVFPRGKGALALDALIAVGKNAVRPAKTKERHL